MGSMHKVFLREGTVLIELRAEYAVCFFFFHRTPVLLEKTTDEIRIIQTVVFGRCFLASDVSLSSQGNSWQY